MEPLLYLTHRIPFPPTKGDKVRSYHLLRFLATRYEVHLGTFLDDPADLVHVPRLAEHCPSSKVVTIRPMRARARSTIGLLTGEPLTLPYYRDASLASWVRAVVRDKGIGKAVLFSSPMAQYVSGLPDLRVIVDFVDVDSEKWRQYGKSRRWPLSMLFEREADRLLAYERTTARSAAASVFVSPAEAELFRSLAPECAGQVHSANNGVDTEFFSPSARFSCPYAVGEEPIVFTGTMDYWPNIDAVCWFANEIFPAILAARPAARFYIVGMQPAAVVRELARARHVEVTGRVDDVRPYLQHARVAVVPLRVARGVQNKALEAMAMARPVVVSASAAQALSVVPGVDVEVAAEAADFARKTIALMDSRHGAAIGASARARVLSDYCWESNLSPFKALLESEPLQASQPARSVSQERALI
jgi:sugar transferase (PEP-CTERM/EpsH1 system associated)